MNWHNKFLKFYLDVFIKKPLFLAELCIKIGPNMFRLSAEVAALLKRHQTARII